MEIPVLVEPLGENRYLARVGGPFALTAEDVSPDLAMQKLRQLIVDRLKNGAQIKSIAVPVIDHPLAKYAGMFKDDPIFQEVKKIITESRQDEAEDHQLP